MPIPIIGLTTRKDLTPGGLPAVMAQQSYIHAIIQAGGAPVLIPSDLPEAGWRELHGRLDGILFTGGGDIAIEHFGGQPHPKVAEVDEARDALELGLARSAAESGTPFLGICRGIQVVNVALGGTLYTDIFDQLEGALDHSCADADLPEGRTRLIHPVHIDEDSQVGQIIRVSDLQVNSLHHQGIKDLAPGLRTVGFAPDGLIEAVEISNHPFAIAVQWHPEWLTKHESAQRLFKAFVDAAQAEWR
jgi:putative glutamine amidotransferase